MSSLRLKTFLTGCLSIKQAKEIHSHILTNSLNNLEPLLVRQVLHSTHKYSRSIAYYVQQILYNLRILDAFPWGFAIRFFSQHGQFEKAFCLYVTMRKLGVLPNSYAISSTIRACARIQNSVGGLAIHGQVHRCGFSYCFYVQTALVDLYSKSGDMNTAQKVFDDISEKNVVSWNSILSGHLKSGNLVEAQRFFDKIPSKDVISWNSILSGYAKAGDMDQAFFLFQKMPERNSASWNTMISGYVDRRFIELARRFFDAMPEKNTISRITMISGYSKGGDVESAREIFDQALEKDQLSYNAMLACYAQNSQPDKALKLFIQMTKADDHIQPDEIALSSLISACSQLGDMRYGSWIESYIRKLGIKMDDHMRTSLIDLYMKTGNIDKAYELFLGMRKKDVVSYTAMILGCGINSKVDDAQKLFKAMVDAQIHPNLVTFTGLLTAFSHAGLVEQGYQCFSSMKDYGLVPSTDHYAIMVDLLGRAGRLEEAYELIKSMPMQPHSGVWGALLLACRLHNNVEFGELAAQHCFELEPDAAGYSSLLSNIYTSIGRWDDARALREATKEKKLFKIPGCSWVEST